MGLLKNGIDQTSVQIGVVDELHDVPSADAADNAQMNEVLGNKAGTSSITVNTTTSIIRYVKGIVGAVAGLNNISTGDVDTACATALSTYDGPTDTEMNAAIDALTDVTAAQVETACDASFATWDPPTKTELDTAESNIRGTDSDTLKTLSEQLDAVGSGTQKSKIAATTEDLNQAAASYDLFTGTTLDVILYGLTLRNANVDASDDSGSFTGISIETDDVTPSVFLSQADGVKANLTSEATLGWDGGNAGVIIKVGTKIQLTIYGGASDDPGSPDIMATYRSIGAGTGTLA